MRVKRRKSNIIIIVFGIILLLISCGYLLYKYVSFKEKVTYEIELINDYIEKKEIIEEPIIEEIKEEKPKKEKQYNMIIEIPKISLKKGLCKVNESCNKVSRNIQVIKESDMPDIKNGNLILAAHNGNSSVSFFNTLNKLKLNDTIYIYYKNVKYEYKLASSYEIKKSGNAIIHRDGSKTTLLLITCKRHTDKQIVYIAYLNNASKY
ncbi:MAG: sortase [Bacilli bacterium]|nr:sortase [Bacilli bacterium]